MFCIPAKLQNQTEVDTMKKLFALMLAAALALSLTACGGGAGDNNTSSEEDAPIVVKSSTTTYIGDWAYDTGKGNVITYHFIKGGTGYYEQSTEKDSQWQFTWEIKDDVVVTTHNALGTTFLNTFEVDDSGINLYCISDDPQTGPYVRQLEQ